MMTEIYRAGPQLGTVRKFILFSLACAVAATWWGWHLFNTYGLSPGDGGVLAPIGRRLAWAIGVASLGIGFAVLMYLYGRLYPIRIRYEPATESLHVRTLELLAGRERVYRTWDVLDGAYHQGRLRSSEAPSVAAPWFAVRLKGRRTPLIVHARGEFPEPELAARVLKVPLEAIRRPAPVVDAEAEAMDFYHDDLADLDPTEGRRRWRRKWLLCIHGFADAEGQRRQWLDPANEHHGFGYIDLSQGYLSDLELSEGYQRAVDRGFVTAEEAAALAPFHALAADYAGPVDDPAATTDDDAQFDRDVIADPAWQQVVAAARQAQAGLLGRLSDPDEQRLLSDGAA